MFSFHYATKEPPKYPLAEGGTISTNEAGIMEYPETVLLMNSFDARGELLLDDTPLQVVSPSVADPTRAPAGYHTLKIEGSLPYALKEGPAHWDKIKDEVAEKIFARLQPRGARSDGGQDSGQVLGEPSGYRAHESGHVARQRACRRPAHTAVRFL